MKYCAVVLLALGCFGCTPGPRTNVVTPTFAASTAMPWDSAAPAETSVDEGFIIRPLNINFGEITDPELRKTLMYRYEESTRALYYYPLQIVVN